MTRRTEETQIKISGFHILVLKKNIAKSITKYVTCYLTCYTVKIHMIVKVKFLVTSSVTATTRKMFTKIL